MLPRSFAMRRYQSSLVVSFKVIHIPPNVLRFESRMVGKFGAHSPISCNVFLLYVLQSTPNRSPLKHMCLIRISNQIKPTYLVIIQPFIKVMWGQA